MEEMRAYRVEIRVEIRDGNTILLGRVLVMAETIGDALEKIAKWAPGRYGTVTARVSTIEEIADAVLS